MSIETVPVLIVGGGGCGLTASLLLSQLGVEHLLVEKHPGTSHLPKAHYLNQRTMEVARQFEFDGAIMEQGAPVEMFGRVRFETPPGPSPLDGQLIHQMDGFGAGALKATYLKDGPILPTNLPQIRLEPILKREAEKRAGDKVRFNQELVHLEMGDEMLATITDHNLGRSYEVKPEYVIAADGGKTLGSRLGVEMQGMKDLAAVVSVHFKADLSAHVHEGTLITWLMNPYARELSGAALVEMGPSWGKDSEEWCLHFPAPPGATAQSEEEMRERVKAVLQLPDLSMEVLAVSSWSIEGVVADRYRVGNVFFVGDAAHRNPPATGLGLNTGIQDVHNLCWKLKLALDGVAQDGLLDSYELERRPVAARNVGWALSASGNHQVLLDAAIGLGPHVPEVARPAIYQAFFAPDEMGETVRARAAEFFGTHRSECQAHDIELGFSYASAAVVSDGSQAPKRDPMGCHYSPVFRPGHRLPHAWLQHEGEEVSAHDFTSAGAGFSLFIADEEDKWLAALEQLPEQTRQLVRPVRVKEIAQSESAREWADLLGEHVVLVRPDNHICAKFAADQESPLGALQGALAHVFDGS